MATKVETVIDGKYAFEIWREGKGRFYANAKTRGNDNWIYKWTSAKTKKAVKKYIEDFIP